MDERYSELRVFEILQKLEARGRDLRHAERAFVSIRDVCEEAELRGLSEAQRTVITRGLDQLRDELAAMK